jgi:surfeit locus 1 family protein
VRLSPPPISPSRTDAFDYSTAAIPEFAWRKVYVTGTFDHGNSIELGPKTRDGQLGYHVFTPLVRGEGQDTILVNRGFVKREFKDAKERPASLVRFSPFF